jgi:hypothetical protein
LATIGQDRGSPRNPDRERKAMTNNRDQSPDRIGAFKKARETARQLWENVRRAFVEFLMIPTCVTVGFLLLALVMYVLDASRAAYGTGL